MLLSKCHSIFDTELFLPIFEEIQRLHSAPLQNDRSISEGNSQLAIRVIADHLRSAILVLAEGVKPVRPISPMWFAA